MTELIVITLSLIVFYFYVFVPLRYMNNNDSDMKIEPIQDFSSEEIKKIVETTKAAKEEEVILPPKPIIYYQLQTDRIKYLMYDPKYLQFNGSRKLYSRIVLVNEWLNEPFYSTIFQLLLMIDKDEFFIEDQNAKVIISHLRNKSNQMEKIKSYQVFSSLKIIKVFFDDALQKIEAFNKEDAQNITLAALILILSKSKHFETQCSFKTNDFFLKDYTMQERVQEIIEMIQHNNNQLQFINDSLDGVFIKTNKTPYVEKVNQTLQIPIIPELPKKELMHLENSVFSFVR